MRHHDWTRRLCWFAALSAALSLPDAAQAKKPVVPTRHAPDALAEGKALFTKNWAGSKPGNPDGDGLGPMFNAASCVACHNQGGVGGGGPIDFNAEMLSVSAPQPGSPQESIELRTVLQAIHPGLLATDGSVMESVTLHRFGTVVRYASLRQEITGAKVPMALNDEERDELQRSISRLPVRPVASKTRLTMRTSQRNTPATFGAGQIDRIPDAALHALATTQAKRFPEISGRVPPVNGNKAGRFGWRGQTEHLRDFVLGACANELGLEVPGVAQPLDPLRPDYKAPGLDLTEGQCNSMTAFVASLPAPKLVKPKDLERVRVAEYGYQVFQKVGCIVCHVENVGPARGVYSDLLLHDMGEGLSDPIAAEPTMVAVDKILVPSGGSSIPGPPLGTSGSAASGSPTPQVSQPGPSRPSNGYSRGGRSGPAPSVNPPVAGQSSAGPTRKFGFSGKVEAQPVFAPLPTNLTQEWRTPPLWGVASSAPYLHDGRAATLLEAIILHGGESQATTRRFLMLPASDRMALLEFLGCLQAP